MTQVNTRGTQNLHLETNLLFPMVFLNVFFLFFSRPVVTVQDRPAEALGQVRDTALRLWTAAGRRTIP